MTEDEVVGWHHRLNGHEFGWIPGIGHGQRGLEHCNSWGRKELDTTERLNRTDIYKMQIKLFHFLHVYSVFNAGSMLHLWTFICCLSLTVRNLCHYLFKLPPPLFILCMLSFSFFLDFNYFHVRNLILSLYFECSTFLIHFWIISIEMLLSSAF